MNKVRSVASRFQPPLMPGLLIAVIAAVAFLTRLLPLLLTGTLGGFRGYDDGVHYAAGVHLIAGSLPYRDYVLVHPPGIALLMAPFALLGHLISDTAGMGAARVLFVLIGTLNTVLIGVLLKKWGYLAVIVGAGLYALWSVATIAERSVMLSPILNVCVLAALLALRSGRRPPRRAVTLAAVFLGLALCFKLWAVLPILVIGVLVAVRFGRWLLLRFALVGAAVCTAVMGLFFVLAPGAMFTDVVMAQLVRTDGAGKALMYRLREFAGVDAPEVLILAVAAMGVLCIVATAYTGLAGRRRLRAWGDEVWWALLAVVISAVLLTSDSFFDHYPNFVAPYLALCLGVAAGAGAGVLSRKMQGQLSRPWRNLTVPLAAVVSVVLLALTGVRGFVLEPAPLPNVNSALLVAAARPYDCIFFTYAYMGVVSDSLSRSMQHGCGSVVDVGGTRMVDGLQSGGPGTPLTRGMSAQELQVSQLKVAQAAVVRSPFLYYGMSAGAIEELRSDFVLTASSGTFQVWARR
ncbi:hypothetical protein [Arthrobacter alpinus]|uniref:hypothetical protein n=1 Tax=Arthrobacter alpinus TaxID=656366 RepID=UPI001646A134|nr:hypothetical protein [Arthrobacter alpinus]